ncbi:hypothetical protein [Mycolicibacterium brisbanense]
MTARRFGPTAVIPRPRCRRPRPTTTDTLSTPADPGYPIQIAGQALLDDGFVIGGVRHQLRDRDGALEALLTVEFPGLTPAPLVAAHRWHLAVEFGNWIIASQSQSDR